MSQPQEPNRPRARRATLAQVAKRAGVSKTTASFVLTGKADQHRISEEVLMRVRQAAIELDYVPNRLVHSLRRGATRILSFYNGFRNRSADDLYLDIFTSAIERAAGKRGYDILIHCDFSRTPIEEYRHLNGGVVDGVLLWAPRRHDPLLPYLRRSRLPTVLVSRFDPEGVLPGVCDDMDSGIQQLTERLYRLGHRDVAILAELSGRLYETEERIEKMQTALRTHGVEVPPERIIDYHGDMTGPLRQLLCSSCPPTALFCWRDRLAYWVVEICESLGVKIPEQLSVVGYDGLYWPAATRHRVTSVKVDLNALADASVALLVDYVEGREVDTHQKVIPVTILEGTTLGPAPLTAKTAFRR
ncbi:transcriptional regulator, LacI family [Chthonomonas calidirosea]|uniref:LacI family DNA-binding transcriptional regulator n=1 Tax=Chthonomonas calidirosea TaxID=454171 RepID=UPI0006DD55E4|nr:LacI family DNA-binding transcriptional regulator [Chthonomonas calidirosea]CEK16401.1 transcriptional regulator, LacI family [Chthonomonas calidirosea]